MGRSLECLHLLSAAVHRDKGVVRHDEPVGSVSYQFSLRRDEPVARAYLIFLFIAMNVTVIETKQLDIAYQLPFCFFSAISSSLCSVLAQKLQNTIKRGIRPFFSNNSVNLALKVYKTCEKHTTNVNKIHTYHTLTQLCLYPTLTLGLPSKLTILVKASPLIKKTHFN